MTDNQERPKTTCIVRDETLIDNAGRQIHQAVLVSGTLDRGMFPFVGHATFMVPTLVNTPQGVQTVPRPVNVQFPIDAVNPQEAFDKYDDMAKKAFEDYKRHQQEQAREKATGIIKPQGM